MSALNCLSRLALVAAVILTSCARHVSRAPIVEGGNGRRGKIAIEHYGCGTCHTVPGIRNARGRTGPPLNDMAGRGYVAGVLANNPENLVRWIMNPPATDSRTAMPFLGVSEAEARDMAEYLYESGMARQP